MTENYDERAEYIAGMRALADVLERTPDIPLPQSGTGQSITWVVTIESDQKAATAGIIRAVGGSWSKRPGGTDGHLLIPSTYIRGLFVEIIADREAVCVRKVVGTETVTKQIPVTFEEQTVEQDIVEWDCGSLMAGVS